MPTATGTVIKAVSDEGLDTYRLNFSANRPAVPDAAARITRYYQQRGQSGQVLQQESDTGERLLAAARAMSDKGALTDCRWVRDRSADPSRTTRCWEGLGGTPTLDAAEE